ncbi:hypothetical protein BDV25DRAFT_74658 [Aspergillus avenaceus]|uniref:SHSP domain-containing protein n=1 Tax=Aspergillus avenaceus TaxID=36643 RepID=A0A5N6TGI0_ASPAV|nr:hypothetical protein BDV25DRAFT_74658 [Aspergillus avenaceus]
MKYYCHPSTCDMAGSSDQAFAHLPRYEDIYGPHDKPEKRHKEKANGGRMDCEGFEMSRFGFSFGRGRRGHGFGHRPHHSHHDLIGGWASRGHRLHNPEHESEYGHGQGHGRFHPRGIFHRGRGHSHERGHGQGDLNSHFNPREAIHRGREHGRGHGRRGRKGVHIFCDSHPHQHYHHHDHQSGEAIGFIPPVDIFVTATETIIYASIPGAQKSDLSIGYDGLRSVLRIAGVVRREDVHLDLLVGERGRQLGTFERDIPVSHGVGTGGIQARLQDGVLKIIVPKSEMGEREIADDVSEERHVHKDGEGYVKVDVL